MKKSIQSVFLAFVVLTVLLSGCAPTSTPVPPTFTPEPTATATPIPSPLSFTVTVPSNTPEYTIVFIEFFDENGEMQELYQMDRISEFEWRFSDINQTLETQGILRYRYSRNSLGYTTAEEFEPDSPVSFRNVAVGGKLEVEDVVVKWRWMPKPGDELPTVSAHVIPFEARINNEPFQKGVLLADFWWRQFDALIPSTNQSMQASHITWVSIAPPWDYLQTEPVPLLGKVGFSYQDAELDNHLAQLRRDGFEILMQPQLAANLPSVDALNDLWWQTWLEQYRTFLLYHVEYANRYNVAYLSTDVGAFIDTNIPPVYREQLNAIFSEARAQYTGKFGRGFYITGNIGESVYCEPVSEAAEWDFFAVALWAGFSTNLDPSPDELRENMLTIFDTCLQPLYTKYNKPFILTQVGYPSIDGGLQGTTFLDGDDPAILPWEPYSNKFDLDLEEQAMGYDAILQAVAQTSYIIGFYPFVYFEDMIPLSKEYNIRGKPAEEILSQWYESLP